MVEEVIQLTNDESPSLPPMSDPGSRTWKHLGLEPISPYPHAEPDVLIHGPGPFVATLPAKDRASEEFFQCKDQIPMWHSDCLKIGLLYEKNSLFIKKRKAGSISLVYEQQLRRRGIHGYAVTVLSGEISAADGIGFVFADRIPCSKNIKRLWSIFVNRAGKVSKRMGETFLQTGVAKLVPITVGFTFTIILNLNIYRATFQVSQNNTVLARTHVDFSNMAEKVDASCGYFCAAIANAGVTVRLVSALTDVMNLPPVEYDYFPNYHMGHIGRPYHHRKDTSNFHDSATTGDPFSWRQNAWSRFSNTNAESIRNCHSNQSSSVISQRDFQFEKMVHQQDLSQVKQTNQISNDLALSNMSHKKTIQDGQVSSVSPSPSIQEIQSSNEVPYPQFRTTNLLMPEIIREFKFSPEASEFYPYRNVDSASDNVPKPSTYLDSPNLLSPNESILGNTTGYKSTDLPSHLQPSKLNQFFSIPVGNDFQKNTAQNEANMSESSLNDYMNHVIDNPDLNSQTKKWIEYSDSHFSPFDEQEMMYPSNRFENNLSVRFLVNDHKTDNTNDDDQKALNKTICSGDQDKEQETEDLADSTSEISPEFYLEDPMSLSSSTRTVSAPSATSALFDFGRHLSSS